MDSSDIGYFLVKDHRPSLLVSLVVIPVPHGKTAKTLHWMNMTSKPLARIGK